MLVLSRKRNERIVIDGNIVITVVQIAPNQVKIGIEAPQDVAVLREEILHRDAPAAGRTPADGGQPSAPTPTGSGLAGRTAARRMAAAH
jgi:carbon storage regulator